MVTTPYQQLTDTLTQQPRTWCITGVAGFIGSNLLKTLLQLNQKVTGIDNLSTGHLHNLKHVSQQVSPQQWHNFTFIRGDICNLDDCRAAVTQTHIVLHQAALGSVPHSIDDPLAAHATNATGFINMAFAAKELGVHRFVYASSSAVYGDDPRLPKQEAHIGVPLSPYAITKYTNELYAHTLATHYHLEVIGLRYFNIFGPHQDPQGPYAAVIPKWINALQHSQPIYIYGDGATSRDFCYVDNVVQANLLAATNNNLAAINQVYNIACGQCTTLTELLDHLTTLMAQHTNGTQTPIYQNFRTGDIKHSTADISKAQQLLGYQPTQQLNDDLVKTISYFEQHPHVYQT